jgi:hypothetical protein
MKPAHLRLHLVGRLGAPAWDWILKPGEVSLVGRKDGETHKPGVDLTPDLSVSRRQAKIWCEKDLWWIEDMSPRGGLVVDGALAAGKGPIPLQVDSEIAVGRSLLVVDPPNRHRYAIGDLTMELDASPALNYSLVHCKSHPITRLALRNTGVEASKLATLSISIPDYTEVSAAVPLPVLTPGEFLKLKIPAMGFDYARINNIREEAEAGLVFSIQGSVVVHAQMKVQPANSWSLDPLHRHTLGAFVQPNHRLIQLLTAEANGSIPETSSHDAGGENDREKPSPAIVEAIYERLRNNRRIKYVLEEPSFEKGCQHIRTPERLLNDGSGHDGQGTCIDLALFMASSLEAAHLQPLIVFVEMAGSELHALLGFWRENRRRQNVVIENACVLEGSAVLLESTGVTWHAWAHDSTPHTLTFREALDSATRIMKEGRFVYAVDISAAREAGIRPLP